MNLCDVSMPKSHVSIQHVQTLSPFSGGERWAGLID